MSTSELVCDFCLSPDPVWGYPTAPMEIIGGPIYGSDDNFAVCQDCHGLLIRQHLVGLAERIVALQPLHQPAGSERDGGVVVYGAASVRLRAATVNVLRFMDARRGPPWRLNPEAPDA